MSCGRFVEQGKNKIGVLSLNSQLARGVNSSDSSSQTCVEESEKIYKRRKKELRRRGGLDRETYIYIR